MWVDAETAFAYYPSDGASMPPARMTRALIIIPPRWSTIPEGPVGYVAEVINDVDGARGREWMPPGYAPEPLAGDDPTGDDVSADLSMSELRALRAKGVR